MRIRTLVLALLSIAVAGAAPARADETALTKEAFHARLATIEAGDHETALVLAEDATKAGLLDEGESLYRIILDSDPQNEVAYYALWHLVRNRIVPKVSQAYARARRGVPDTFAEYETRFYVVLSDADPAWVREQGERLELAFDRFIRFANEMDLRPHPPRHKLVAVVFSSRASFKKYATKDGNTHTGIIAGYYSLPNDRLVFFHVESSDNVAAVRAQLSQEWDSVTATARTARRARMTGKRNEAREMQRLLDRQRARLDAEEDRLNAFARERSIAVTVHEAIHQLMFHTGVQTLSVQHPMWLTEGLATAFETDDPRSYFGPSQEYGPRRDAFRALLARNGQVSLRRLLGLDSHRVMGDPRLVDVAYHQGYALVTWLARNRRAALQQYMLDLNALPPGVPSADLQEAVFERSFGDIERLEEAWLRAERAGG